MRKTGIHVGGGGWALVLLAIGWGPLFLLDPLGTLFPHLEEDSILEGWAMAIVGGIGPLLTLLAVIVAARHYLRKWTGPGVPTLHLPLDAERDADQDE